MKQRLIAIALLLLTSMYLFAHDFEVDGIYYNVLSEEERTVEVTYKGDEYLSRNEYIGKVRIPLTVSQNDKTYNVVRIGDKAFHQCWNLSGVDLPSSLTSIGENAFVNCSSLTELVIPNSVTSIAEFAFQQCSIVGICLPNAITSIPAYAFRNCTKLKSITLPSLVTTVGRNAFEGCTNLKSLTFSKSFTTIGAFMIYDCPSLETIIVDPENPDFDSRDNCNAIIQSSNNRLVLGCKNTIIPSTVTGIESEAFRWCSGLSSIYIPSSIIDIADYPFRECSGIVSIIVDPQNPQYDSRGNCNAIINKSNDQLIVGCKNTIILNTVKSIGNYAFSSCQDLTTMEIPSSVTSIGDGAFEKCSGLESIIVPKYVQSIGGFTFSECYNLKSITCRSIMPPAIKDRHFANLSPEKITLYVPYCSVDAYANANAWKDCNIVGYTILTEKVTLDKQTLLLKNGTNEQLIANDFPEESTNPGYVWSSSDPGVATVDEKGRVTSVSCGQTTITATTMDGTNNSATCLVTVVEESSNSIYTEDVTVPTGMTTTLPIYVDNAEGMSNIQFDICLPQSIYVVNLQKGQDRFDNELDHVLSYSDSNISSNSIHVTLISTTNQNFYDKDEAGNDCRTTSPLLNIDIMVSPWADTGEYEVQLQNIVMSNNNGGITKKYTCGTKFTKLTISKTMIVQAISENETFGNAVCAGTLYDPTNGIAGENSLVTFTATPATGYSFSCWMNGEENYSSENPLTTTVTRDLNLTAVFVPNKYKVKFTAEGQVIFEEEMEYKSTITPPVAPEKAGYVFYSWGNVPATVPAYDLDFVADYIILGDLYEDGEVDVADVTKLVGVVVNNTPISSRDKKKADVFVDNSIDVADVSSLVSMALVFTPIESNQERYLVQSMDRTESTSLNAKLTSWADDNLNIALGVESFGLKVKALQFDLQLPEGLNLASATLKKDVCSSHFLQSKRLPDGTVRMIIYSTNNVMINVDNGALLDISCKISDAQQHDDEVSITNVIAIDADGEKHKIKGSTVSNMLDADSVGDFAMSSLHVSTGYGVLQISSDMEKMVEVYSLSGAVVYKDIVEPAQKIQIRVPGGIYLVNGKKVIVK